MVCLVIIGLGTSSTSRYLHIATQRHGYIDKQTDTIRTTQTRTHMHTDACTYTMHSYHPQTDTWSDRRYADAQTCCQHVIFVSSLVSCLPPPPFTLCPYCRHSSGKSRVIQASAVSSPVQNVPPEESIDTFGHHFFTQSHQGWLPWPLETFIVTTLLLYTHSSYSSVPSALSLSLSLAYMT